MTDTDHEKTAREIADGPQDYKSLVRNIVGALEAERAACIEAPVELKGIPEGLMAGFVKGVNAKTAAIRARKG